MLDGANLALISLAGEYAVLEAHRALSAGMHVFLFSDHISAADEVALKRRGVERGLLVMGPGCGTAMLGQVGLGFANEVRSGPIGIVAAAGTGAQEAAILLDGAGTGVSHIVGVGGRDLSADVGGIMFREGMRLLAADDDTETLLLVSKPPAREVVDGLGSVDVDGRRVIAAFVGWEGGDAPFEVHPTLEAGAFAAAGVEAPGHLRAGRASRRAPSSGARRHAARALLRRHARLRGGDDPGARARPDRRQRGRRRSATATVSSTSARRSTRRAARTRWSTSSRGCGCSATPWPTRASVACCSTSSRATDRTPTRPAASPSRSPRSRAIAR